MHLHMLYTLIYSCHISLIKLVFRSSSIVFTVLRHTSHMCLLINSRSLLRVIVIVMHFETVIFFSGYRSIHSFPVLFRPSPLYRVHNNWLPCGDPSQPRDQCQHTKRREVICTRGKLYFVLLSCWQSFTINTA